MKIGQKQFVIGERTYVMGILNVTPDSFSDGGKFNTIENALEQAGKMIEQGVDIIDIGGESTRQGYTYVEIEDEYTYVEIEDEINRVVPIIKAIKGKFNVAISIDTYKGRVAEAAIESGADLINDIWGLKKDPYMVEVAGRYNIPCCLMHNREVAEYKGDIIEEMKEDLQESIDLALNAGVSKENIMLDPGIGFVKTYEQNIEVMNRLEELNDLGYPVLLGTSRKSMIGIALDLPAAERVEGTLATTSIGIMKGCDFIRVHDVLENKRVCLMTDAIIRRK